MTGTEGLMAGMVLHQWAASGVRMSTLNSKFCIIWLHVPSQHDAISHWGDCPWYWHPVHSLSWQTGIHSANYNYSHSAFFWQHYFAKYWHIIWPTSRSKYNMNTRHGSTSKTIPCELTLLHLVPTATCRSFSHWAAKILLILFRSYWRSHSSRGRWRARYGSTSCFCRFVPQPICRLNSAWLTKSQLGPGALSSSASQDLTHLCRTSGLAFRNTGRQCCSILRKYTVFIIGYIKHTHNTAQSHSSQAMDTLTTLLQGLFNNPKDGKRRMKDMAKKVKNTEDCIRRQRQQLNKYNAFLLSDNSSALMCAVQSRKLHTCSWLHSVQCDACCVAATGREDKNAAFGEFLAHTVRQKRTATVTLSNGVLTASEAEHWQKARPKKVRTSWVSQAAVTVRYD